MATPINTQRALTAGAGVKDWIPLNHYGPPEYQINIVVSGTVNYDLEGTNARLNRGETGDEFILDDISNTPLSGQTASVARLLAPVAMEFLRINQNSGTGSVSIHVKQQGRVT